MSEIKEREQMITDVDADILENRLLNVIMYKNECNKFQDNYFLFSQHCMVAQEISFVLLTKQIHLHISIRYGIVISNYLINTVLMMIGVRLQVHSSSKHGAFTQCCFNVGPVSKTVGQH